MAWRVPRTIGEWNEQGIGLRVAELSVDSRDALVALGDEIDRWMTAHRPDIVCSLAEGIAEETGWLWCARGQLHPPNGWDPADVGALVHTAEVAMGCAITPWIEHAEPHLRAHGGIVTRRPDRAPRLPRWLPARSGLQIGPTALVARELLVTKRRVDLLRERHLCGDLSGWVSARGRSQRLRIHGGRVIEPAEIAHRLSTERFCSIDEAIVEISSHGMSVQKTL